MTSRIVWNQFEFDHAIKDKIEIIQIAGNETFNNDKFSGMILISPMISPIIVNSEKVSPNITNCSTFEPHIINFGKSSPIIINPKGGAKLKISNFNHSTPTIENYSKLKLQNYDDALPKVSNFEDFEIEILNLK